MTASNRARTRALIDRVATTDAGRAGKSKKRLASEFSYDEIEAVRETALAIANSLRLEQVLSTVAERAVELIQAAASCVYLIDHNTDRLKLIAGHNIPASYASTVLDPGEGVAGHVAKSGHPLVVEDYSSWNERYGLFDAIAGDAAPRQVSIAGLPLIYNQQVLGVLEVICIGEETINDRAVALLQLMTPHASTALAHAQLFERNQQVMNLLEMINDRAAAVSSVGTTVIEAGHDLTKMSAAVLVRTIGALHLAAGKVFLKDPETNQLIATASENLPLADGESGLQHAAEHCMGVRHTFLLQNLPALPWTASAFNWLSERGLGASVCVPLTIEDEVVGVLQAVAQHDRVFDTGELDTLHIIAGQLALGVTNARLFTRVRAEQRQMAAILSSSGDVVIGLDATGHIQVANPAAERAFGFVAQAAIGRPLHEVTLNVALTTTVEVAIKSNQKQPVGMEVPLADDTFLFCNLSPIVEPSGKITGWVAVMQDITRFKETERLKSDMILTASHDLRNPVNLTLGALELLGRNTTNWTAMQHESYSLAQLGVHRIEALIADLLDLERIERRVGLKLAACDLSEIATNAATELSLQAQQRQQKLDLNISSAGLATRVRGDAQRLYQVTSNLLSNAIKYTPPGGQISVSVYAQDDLVQMDVTDNGPGIPVEAQARVFERFYRVPSTALEEHGTGLGLAIVKSIVEQHGGRVHLTSVANQGSTFSVTLPKWTDTAAEKK